MCLQLPLSVFFKEKKKENVLKIFTEVLFQRLHHKLVLITLKISVPINLVFLLLATWFKKIIQDMSYMFSATFIIIVKM